MAITSKEHKTGSFFIKNNFEGESWVKTEVKGDFMIFQDMASLSILSLKIDL